MHRKTSTIKKQLQEFSPYDYQSKIDCLLNAYDGEECFILGCGPSLNECSPETLNSLLKNKLVFSIKQALLIHNDSDFHFCNDNNITTYERRPQTVFCFSATNFSSYGLFKQANQNDGAPDLFTEIESPFLKKPLSSTLMFDDYLLEKSILRPWGPGIISEVVFYMAVHLGVKKIYTLGWDLGSSKELEEGKHFYDDFISKSEMVNPAIIEIERDTQKNDIFLSKKIKEWLASTGIDLVTLSRNTNVHSSINRQSIESLIPGVNI